jgi:SAM-dependent methyltransferase
MPMILSPDVLAHRDWLLSMAVLPESGAVVDLGCGAGADLLSLASRSRHPKHRFVGLDASEKSVTEARTQSQDPRVEFGQARLEERLPFGDREFDVAYSSNLLECLADPIAFAAEVSRILKPGGIAVIGHWDWDSQVFDGSDKALVRHLVHAFADWKQAWMDHADGWMGRRLWGVFNHTGLFEGTTQARVLTNTIYEEPWYGYERAKDLRSIVKCGLASAADVASFTAEQEALAATDRYFYSITGYAFVGRRRDA